MNWKIKIASSPKLIQEMVSSRIPNYPLFLNCNYYFPTILQTTKRCGQTEAETQ